ncbi:hypothetical protein ACTL6U_10090 [Rhodovibrionaceae bacterium A322]
MARHNPLSGVPDEGQFVIADRRDMLGGRLMALLNGLRLAESSNRRFLMTWRSGQDESLFAFMTPLKELFKGGLIEPYDPDSGNGTIIPIRHPLLFQATEDRRPVPTPEEMDYGLKPLLFRPQLKDGQPYKVSNRFDYLSLDGESFSEAQQGLAAQFHNLSKTAVIEDTIAQLDEKLAAFGRLMTLHVRRLHLVSTSRMVMARFDSYWSLDSCSELIRTIEPECDHVLVGSDSDYMVSELKAAHPGKVLHFPDLIDLKTLTPLQRALMEIVFLSRGQKIFGPLSAFSILAATIGGSKYHNSLAHLASKDLLKGDQTHAIAYWKCQQESRVSKEMLQAADQRGNSSLALRLLPMLRQRQETLSLAIRTLARRVLEYPHPAPELNFNEYLTAIEKPASHIGSPLQAEVLLLRQAFEAGRSDKGAAISELLEKERSEDRDLKHLVLVALVLEADKAAIRNSFDEALRSYFQALVLSHELDLNPRGLLLRRSFAGARAGNMQFCLDDCRRAVRADPDFAPSYHLLGKALARCGMIEESLDAHVTSTRLDPYVAQFWRAAADLSQRLGKKSDAQIYRRNAEHCDPTGVEHLMADY